MRVAVIGGNGRWGKNIVRTLESLPGASVAWIAGSRDDWRPTLNDPAARPDAVAIASPSAWHADHALAALSAGLPVFVEKPFALSVADAERVRDEAARRRLVVTVDHVHLFNPAWHAVKTGAAARGGAHVVVSAAGNAGPFRPDVSPLWDWGAHDVAMALDLFGGTPVLVRGKTEADGNDRLNLQFAGGWTWHALVGSRFAARTRRVRVGCPQGEVVWDESPAPQVTVGGAPVPVAGEPPLHAALREFLSAVKEGRPSRSDAAFGAEVVRVLEACGPARPA